MESTAIEATMKAPSPFNDSKADIILRSSDHVDFHVIQSFLSYSSDVFAAMFTLPQPSNYNFSRDSVTEYTVPVVLLAEDSGTLTRLLRYAYPISAGDAPALDSIDDVISVMDAADKYGMEGALEKAQRSIVAPKLVEKEPLRVWAVAHRYKLEREVRIAARHTLSLPVLQRPFVPELEHIPAAAYYRLLRYHRKCGDAASALVNDCRWITTKYVPSGVRNRIPRKFVWFADGPTSHGDGCSMIASWLCVSQDEVVMATKWWDTYMQGIGAALKEKPCAAEVDQAATTRTAMKAATMCKVCRLTVWEDMPAFIALFKEEVERVISEVRAWHQLFDVTF
ncbi:hypothetical protein PLICRDRAFT_303163 [Plicaturopsis crispa FD-325 SS-3]|nr:hypothetical protein PLICRDRAFT_303163 [Plicaturopsis crispa FD-325 SS-3]